jgi:hypothetical protein
VTLGWRAVNGRATPAALISDMSEEGVSAPGDARVRSPDVEAGPDKVETEAGTEPLPQRLGLPCPAEEAVPPAKGLVKGYSACSSIGREPKDEDG